MVGAGAGVLLLAAGFTLWQTRPWERLGSIAPDALPAGSEMGGVGEADRAVPPAANTDARAVREVAEKFTRALSNGDLAAAQAVVTPAAKPDAVKNFLAFISEAGAVDASTRFVLQEPRVQGDAAEVQVEVSLADDQGSMRIETRRENGADWRVWRVNLEEDDPATPNGQAVSLPIDFTADADPMQALMNAMTGALAQAFEEGMTQMASGTTGFGEPGPGGFGVAGDDDLPPWDLEAIRPVAAAWRVDFAEQPGDARALVDAQMKTLGLRPSPSVFTVTSGRKVELPARMGTPLELIEEVGRQLGWAPGYAGGQLSFERGARKEPVAFAGPFMAEIRRVTPPTADGKAELTIEVVGVGIPDALRERWQSGVISLDDVAIQAPDGTDLHDFGRLGGFSMSMNRPGGPLFTHEENVGLQQVGLEVDRIALLRADLLLPMPPELSRALVFDRLAEGTSVSGHGMTATIEELVTQENGTSLSMSVKGRDPGRLGLLATDAAGARIEVPGRMWQGHGETYRVTFEAQGKVAAATLLLDSDGERQRFAFEFRDVPLRAETAAAGRGMRVN